MTLVKCRTLYNTEKLVPAETMVQRPSVYGVILHDGDILLAKTVHTSKYVLPGGGIHKGEEVHTALIREVNEETGIDVRVGDFLYFETDFFYYDPLDVAIHGFLFYYRCEPLTFEIPALDLPSDEDLVSASWVDVHHLTSASFQSHGETTMDLLKQCLER
jgi:8-oxo-dGTP pyrophosphatase MutT (NUDIX family)